MSRFDAQCLAELDRMARAGLRRTLTDTTINHTLAALRARHLTVAGVILSGTESAGNAGAIARHGHVRILHRLPPVAPVSPASPQAGAALFPPNAAVRA